MQWAGPLRPCPHCTVTGAARVFYHNCATEARVAGVTVPFPFVGTATFTVTRDADPPVVTVTAGGAPTITVGWSGDDGSGAGVAGYDLDVSVDGGAWQRILTHTQSTNTQYPGEFGHRYIFRVTATDHVSNAGQGEASTIVAAVTKYYYFNGQRVAMRSPEGVYYLHADHLGSTSLTTDDGGGVVARQLYHPYGTVRWREGTLPTDFGFTGQRHDGTGLIFMHARYYHPALGHFISADSIVPEPSEPQHFNRYSYAANNPLRYIDPTGHGIKEWFEDKIKDVIEATTSRPVIRDYGWQILKVANARDIDPVILATIIYHESQAQERFLVGDAGERWEVILRKDSDYASIGVGQMQLRRAKELEDAGYIEPKASKGDRVSALLNIKTAIDYTGALLQSNFDQLDAWATEHSVKFSDEARTKLAVLSYNWGWEEVQGRLDSEASDIGRLNQVTGELIYETLYIDEALSPRNIGAVEDMLGVCSVYH